MQICYVLAIAKRCMGTLETIYTGLMLTMNIIDYNSDNINKYQNILNNSNYLNLTILKK